MGDQWYTGLGVGLLAFVRIAFIFQQAPILASKHIKPPMSLSIIGCVVNGPGEALMTDVGFTGGGNGSGMVYLAGKQSHKLGNDAMIDHIVEQVEARAAVIEAETQAAEQAAE